MDNNNGYISDHSDVSSVGKPAVLGLHPAAATSAWDPFDDITEPPPPAPEPLGPGWSCFCKDDGMPYYVHRPTLRVTWTDPRLCARHGILLENFPLHWDVGVDDFGAFFVNHHLQTTDRRVPPDLHHLLRAPTEPSRPSGIPADQPTPMPCSIRLPSGLEPPCATAQAAEYLYRPSHTSICVEG